MYSTVILPRHGSRLSCLCRSWSTVSQKLPQSNKSSDGITPPVRIQRGPTDILQALAATIGPDPTAAHYKYHDDPYLIPLSNFRKRAYALASEAGRKAAAWVRDEHSELFTTREWDPPEKMKTAYHNAEPRIEAFTPKPIYNDESKVSEEDLEYTINNALLEDSIKVYQLLGGSSNISDDLKLSLLQLISFYNEKEPDSIEWLEERWFSANTRERQAATWRLGGLADKIFTSMDPKTPEAYCAIIKGMAKYFQAERAYKLTQEAIEQGIPLSTSVFNSLLSCVGFLKEGTTLRTDALKDLLTQMDQLGLTPNEETLTSCLRSISAWGSGRVLQELALQVLAEFRQLDIQPGLSDYYYLLCLFCKDRGPRLDILTTILNDLESRDKLVPKAATDTNFFITAMGVCSDHLQDIKMTERLHALLMKGDNYILVGDAYKESIYYRHLVTAACRHAPFERTTQLLDTLVPNVYVPEPSVMEEIIKTLEVAGAGDRLAQAWSQLVVFGIAKRTKLIERLLGAMRNCYEYQTDDVKASIRAAAADILTFEEASDHRESNKDTRTPQQLLSANALTNLIELCSDVQDKSDPGWETVMVGVQRLQRSEASGVPSNPAALSAIASRAAKHGKLGVAAAAVQYLSECGFEEATTAAVDTLSVIMNRPQEEVEALLQKPISELDKSLQPAALSLVQAYRLAKTGVPAQESDSSTSSGSDSDSSSDDE